MLEFFVKGGPVMWPLLLCSLISLTVIFERLFFWWRAARGRDDALVEKILDRTRSGDFVGAAAAGPDAPGAAARVLAQGLIHREYGLAEGMQVAAEAELDRMRRGLGALDTIITLAPLLGILGTVLGIIQSFRLLGAAGIEDPKAVTGGIAQALITTAAGLTIALVTLVPYNYLLAKVQKFTRHLETVTTRLEVAYRFARTGEPNDATDRRI